MASRHRNLPDIIGTAIMSGRNVLDRIRSVSVKTNIRKEKEQLKANCRGTFTLLMFENGILKPSEWNIIAVISNNIITVFIHVGHIQHVATHPVDYGIK